MTHACETPQSAHANILVAEDDVVSRVVINRILEQAGYSADFANDGHEAIIALKRKHYDLVLMDCFMPRMDGFAAIRLIRNADPTEISPRIPVIALTGLSGDDDRRRCLDAGMDDYICKPVRAGELVTAIERCLGRGVDPASVSQQSETQEQRIEEDAFLGKVIDSFLEEIPQVVDSLQRAVEQEDLTELESIGHRLRGVSDILGVSSLSSRSGALEQAGKAGDLISSSKLASELIAELQKMAVVITS